MFMYLLETANIIFLSFIRFELLSFEHGNPIVSSIILIMDKTQVNSDCEFYDIYTYFLNKVRALRCYGAVSKSTKLPSNVRCITLK